MNQEEPIKITLTVSHKIEEFKTYKPHDNCHIH